MTLISLSLNYGYPIMMADILITSSGAEGNFETPTFVTGTNDVLDKESTRKPTGLKQKLYVINDRLCIAIGGRGDRMYSFLNRIKGLFGSIDFDEKYLSEFLLNYDKEEEKDLLAIVLWSTKNAVGKIEFTTIFLGEIKTSNNEELQQLFVAGSGVNHFL